MGEAKRGSGWSYNLGFKASDGIKGGHLLDWGPFSSEAETNWISPNQRA